MSGVRVAWRDGGAVVVGTPDPERLAEVRRHRDELMPLVRAFGDVTIELRPKPVVDWEAVRQRMLPTPRRGSAKRSGAKAVRFQPGRSRA